MPGVAGAGLMGMPLVAPGLPPMLQVGPNGAPQYVLPPHLGDPTHAAIFVAAATAAANAAVQLQTGGVCEQNHGGRQWRSMVIRAMEQCRVSCSYQTWLLTVELRSHEVGRHLNRDI
jgi:hypothetical protein